MTTFVEPVHQSKIAMESLIEVNFTGRNGERELLWCIRRNSHEFEVRTPPVFVDNISVGTIIRASRGDDGELHHTATVEQSPGATVRFICSEGVDAPEIYRTVLLPFGAEQQISVGPASFVSSQCVSFHVRHRDKRSEALLDVLDQLEADGLVRVWEIGDPLRAGGARELDSNADAVIRHERPDAAQ